MRVPWLSDCLRNAGLRVVEVQGWRGRGRELQGVEGIVCHHTATPPSLGPIPVATMLAVKGNPTTPPPLAQLGLARDGTYYVVTDGRANHNGFGTYVPGRQWGNNAIGIEAMNDGKGEPWLAAQMDAYTRGVAALLKALRLAPDRVAAHRETDPKRKPDPVGIDMDAFRTTVGQLLHPEGDDDLTPDQAKKLDDVHEGLKQLRAIGEFLPRLQHDLAERIAKRPTEDEVRKIIEEAIK